MSWEQPRACKECGVGLYFVKMRSRRRMPVDAKPAEHHDKGNVITQDGVLKCDGGFGWRPHWAT